jgi:hypothetical protein
VATLYPHRVRRVGLSTGALRGNGEGNMRFQAGRFTCEMSRDNHGRVVTKWWPEVPKYLNRAERRQYQARRVAFLEKPSGPIDSPATKVVNS